MRLKVIACLLAGLGCVAERAAVSTPKAVVDRRSSEILSQAPATRARTESPSALGSFYRRVWADEFERLLQPVRTAGLAAALPEHLTGPTVARWQSSLNDAWQLTDGEDVRLATNAVIAEVAPARDAVHGWAIAQSEPVAAITAALAVSAILSEVVQEAELLALRDSGSIAAFEQFISRYPTGPYTGSVLFALGATHEERRDLAEAKEAFGRMLERFPTHPLANEVRTRLGAL